MKPYQTQAFPRTHHAGILLLLLVSLMAAMYSPAPAKAVNWSVSNFVSETYIGPNSLISKTTAMAWMPPMGTGLVLLAQKRGAVRVYNPATQQVLTTSFILLDSMVNNMSDRGLLGIAVDPDFPTRPYVYLLFTYDPPELPCTQLATTKYDCTDGNGARVGRLMRVEADPLANPPYSKAKTDPATRKILLGTNSTYANIGAPDKNSANFPPPNGTPPSCDVNGVPVQDCLPADSRTHTIGTVMFGPDKKLYVSNGDGSEYSFVDPKALRAQNLDSLAGKVLRIDPDTGEGLADNPFYDGNPSSNRSRVWMYGLRNPFRITIHPITGEVYVGDVGWNVWEEINRGKGKNFGWPCYEGVGRQPAYETTSYTAATCAALYAQPNGVQPPLYTYSQMALPPPEYGNGAAMAGAFYFGTNYPAQYNGALFIGDYALDRTEYIKFDSAGNPTVYPFAKDMADRSAATSFEKSIVQMIPGPEGDLYYVIFDNLTTNGFNEIRHIRYQPPNTNAPPVADFQASPTNGAAPLTVNFVNNSTDPNGDTLSYEWNFGDNTSSTLLSPPAHTYNTAKNYTVSLTVRDPGGLSDTKTVTISAGNTPPSVTITTPVDNTHFSIGDFIQYAGVASDAQDGNLTAQIQWQGILHHDDHTHPMFDAQGANGQFEIEDHADAMWVELCASATDSGGLSSTSCVDLIPNKVTYTFTTEPSGRSIIYEGVQHQTPFSVDTIVGATQQISTASVQDGYSFVRWDNTTASRCPSTNCTLNMGDTPRTITAYFQQQPSTVTYTFTSQPPGREIVYDGTPRITPFTVSVLSGSSHDISVVTNQRGFTFSHWEDNSTTTNRTLQVGSTDQTITATFVTKQPDTVTYTFTSVPAGIVIKYGDTPKVTPFSVAFPVGSTQEIVVPEPQKQMTFVQWEDSSTSNKRTLQVGSTDATITATFANQSTRAAYEFVTQPEGLPIMYEGQKRYTPFSVAVDVGSTKQVSAYTLPGGLSFVRWEDGSTTADRALPIVVGPQTIKAFFEWRVVVPIIKR